MVFTAVTLVWFSRLALRALKVNVRGWSLLPGSLKERLRLVSRCTVPGVVPMFRWTLPFTVLMVSNPNCVL